MLPLLRGTCRVMEMEMSEELFLSLLQPRCTLSKSRLPCLLGTATAGDTVVLLPEGEEPEEAYLLPETSPEQVLALLVNEGKKAEVRQVRLLPRIILMRVPGNLPKVFDQIREDFSGTPVPLDRIASHRSELRGVGVCFTPSRLNRNISPEEFHSQALDIPVPYNTLYQQLRARAFEYVNQGMEKRDWYEVNIMIYDKYERYLLQYKRVMTVLVDLGVGLVLGEAWEKDYGRLLLPLQVYRIRLFTFLPPEEIKEILIGLEYAEDGSRLCDLDIRLGKKKGMSWTDSKGKNSGNREEFGRICREKLLRQIDSRRGEQLLQLERELLREEHRVS